MFAARFPECLRAVRVVSQIDLDGLKLGCGHSYEFKEELPNLRTRLAGRLLISLLAECGGNEVESALHKPSSAEKPSGSSLALPLPAPLSKSSRSETREERGVLVLDLDDLTGCDLLK